jgi:hypothetical protein
MKALSRRRSKSLITCCSFCSWREDSRAEPAASRKWSRSPSAARDIAHKRELGKKYLRNNHSATVSSQGRVTTDAAGEAKKRMTRSEAT